MASSEQIIATFLQRVGGGHADDVRALLLAVPALVNAVGPHPYWGGRPQPLHVAIERGRRDLFDILIEHGADVNGKNDEYDRWSPLMLALHGNRDDMRDELLRRGARIGVPEALLLGNDEMTEALLARGLPAAAPNGGSLRAFARTPAAIDFLIAVGADTEAKDRWDTTPITAISRLGTRGRPLVAHLVSLGVPASPAEYARTGDFDTLAQLVGKDPAIATLDAVMMAAVDCGHHGLVTWLLARGGNANAREAARSRQTALHAAAWNGDLQMAEILVGAGADVSARDAEHNSTPLGFAETSREVTNNPRCAEVAAFLTSVSPPAA
jgi:ankyrin repeat protein